LFVVFDETKVIENNRKTIKKQKKMFKSVNIHLIYVNKFKMIAKNTLKSL